MMMSADQSALYRYWQLTLPIRPYFVHFIIATALSFIVLLYWLGASAFFISLVFGHYYAARKPPYLLRITVDRGFQLRDARGWHTIFAKQIEMMPMLIYFKHSLGTTVFWQFMYDKAQWHRLRVLLKLLAIKNKEGVDSIWHI